MAAGRGLGCTKLPGRLVPDLVVVSSGTMPHLNLRIYPIKTTTSQTERKRTNVTPRNDLSISQIQTLVLVSPSNPIIVRQGELLISISRATSPDLHLDTVRGGSVSDVEALVTEDDQLVSTVVPRLI
jgi:hypothetical protein